MPVPVGGAGTVLSVLIFPVPKGRGFTPQLVNPPWTGPQSLLRRTAEYCGPWRRMGFNPGQRAAGSRAAGRLPGLL